MNFEEEFIREFGDKYRNLTLKEVVVKKQENLCTITFLYPSIDEEMSDEQKQEIVNWIAKTLGLEQIDLRVKFMRAFVEEKLIRIAIQNYFKKHHKLVTTYLSDSNFSIKITPIDVCVEVETSTRMAKFFSEHRISAELAKFLKIQFLVDFVVILKENSEIVDDVDIENVVMKTYRPQTQRYAVEVVKEVVGKNFIPRPEYMNNIRMEKQGVIVAGYLKKIERKEYVRKTGKYVGQARTFFTFELQDEKGKLEGIYFSAKKYVADVDALEECMYVLVQGDVRKNQLGKLCLYAEKIALAAKLEFEDLPTVVEEEKEEEKVVKIEKLTALQQDTMFDDSNRYTDKIKGKTIVVFDIETTGLDFATDQIIELGAVKIENGNIVEKFSTFVKPTKPIPAEVVDLTGITEDMVEDAPSIRNVIKEFYDFTRGCVLCGHNVIGFDIKFIRREGEDYGLEFDNDIIDTMKEAQASRKLKITRFNLGAVVKALGLVLEGAHRAWNDAYATAQVLLKLNEND
ncbi:MAG: ribonuclease H-like domain-containing protein [Clostridia bacterium]|nr:ribonuclease H-like domain-containing protein [Clostridia bacterium]